MYEAYDTMSIGVSDRRVYWATRMSGIIRKGYELSNQSPHPTALRILTYRLAFQWVKLLTTKGFGRGKFREPPASGWIA